jgi:hypothetical protein
LPRINPLDKMTSSQSEDERYLICLGLS